MCKLTSVTEFIQCYPLEKKWNFLLKHSTGNVQEISIDIYCSKTVPRKFQMSGLFPGFYGNFEFHALFLHPERMKFPEITGNFICYMQFPVQGHVTFT